ncbi:MAG: hypothetical protein WC757_04310 [Candidatus Paceibacterota bacterium]|jgi:hypothetical protein
MNNHNPSQLDIKLSDNEISYLKSANFLTQSQLTLLDIFKWNSNSSGILSLSPITAEDFREVFTEQLAKFGFDESYNLTDEGKILEELIDHFYYNPQFPAEK